MTINSYKDAKTKFLSGDFASVENFFKQNGFILEYGYCKLLSGSHFEAKSIFNSIYEQDLRAKWATGLIQFIEGYVQKVPSYFQIRNFLEIDLHMLIQAGRPEYVENIINGADLFFSVNPESYKFIARVMMFNDFDGIAFHYLQKAKDKFYYDPELHLMLAQSYLKSGEVGQAKHYINVCLGILPNYFPAKRLRESIK